jgi:L-threonylcarbamoyladenylate synthase
LRILFFLSCKSSAFSSNFAGFHFYFMEHNQASRKHPEGSRDKFMEDISRCIEVLKAGGIILYPSDTLWGIGCDATNEKAVSRICELKKREESQSMLVLVEHADRIGRHVRLIPDIAIQLIEVNDKPMTLIYPDAVNLAKNLVSADGSIGIRITSDDFCKKLISSLNRPIVSTSANFSGEPAPETFRDIPDDIKNGVDYVVKWRQNDKVPGVPSSVIKVGLRGEVEIIRP